MKNLKETELAEMERPNNLMRKVSCNIKPLENFLCYSNYEKLT